MPRKSKKTHCGCIHVFPCAIIEIFLIASLDALISFLFVYFFLLKIKNSSFNAQLLFLGAGSFLAIKSAGPGPMAPLLTLKTANRFVSMQNVVTSPENRSTANEDPD